MAYQHQHPLLPSWQNISTNAHGTMIWASANFYLMMVCKLHRWVHKKFLVHMIFLFFMSLSKYMWDIRTQRK